MRDQEVNITSSIVDRLIDLDPRGSYESPKSRMSSLRELKQSVRRDIEWLLNARCISSIIDDNLEEVRKSVAVYGLPDFTGVGAKDPNEQLRVTQAIERAIEIFEPRFIGTKVTLEPVTNLDKQLTFRIEAHLDIEPAPEPIVFDTYLQFGSGEFTVKES